MKEINDIKEVHNILYEALCYFGDFCHENGIKYFLSNGTLLGAAKNRDFIPWDDDVDILIPREHYDKLMNLSTINSGKYKLFCKEQIPEWRMPYAKLSCEDTVVEEGEYNFGRSVGLSVDIFPIDNWSSCLLIAKMQAIKSELLKRMMVCSIGGEFHTKKTGVKRLVLKSIWTRGKKLGHHRIQQNILKSVNKTKSKKSKYVGCRVWTCHLDSEVFPEEYFLKTVYLDFRDRKFPAIENYEIYLSSLYGNWRAELPPERQCSNHDVRVWYKNAE